MLLSFSANVSLFPSCDLQSARYLVRKCHNGSFPPSHLVLMSISHNRKFDEEMMRRCISLASRAAGQTRPNPPVGCVITSPEGVVLGEGYHHRAGQPHAEVEALEDAKQAGNDVRDSTVYVSLEPCNHRGKTGPCAEALVHAGVKRVVAGIGDPNPRNVKSGGELLIENNVDFEMGVEREKCYELVEGFMHRIHKGSPFGVWKYAMTLDGRIATESGSSKWISGEHSRRWVQRLRESVDAIVIGGNTMRADNPRLTVRERTEHQEHNSRDEGSEAPDYLSPMRVIMTKSIASLDPTARIFSKATVASIPTIILTTPFENDEKAAKIANYLRSLGVTVEALKDLTPKLAMQFLFERGALNVLWECGGNLAARALADGCIQKVHAFIAPKVVGGVGPSPSGSPPVALDMQDAWELQKVKTELFGRDILVSGYVSQP